VTWPGLLWSSKRAVYEPFIVGLGEKFLIRDDLLRADDATSAVTDLDLADQLVRLHGEPRCERKRPLQSGISTLPGGLARAEGG
jgi:hypothetical protein